MRWIDIKLYSIPADTDVERDLKPSYTLKNLHCRKFTQSFYTHYFRLWPALKFIHRISECIREL